MPRAVDPEEVFEELQFPSASRLKRVLTACGIAYNAKEVDRRVRGDTAHQVQAPRYKWCGERTVFDLDSCWFADLMRFSEAPTEDTVQDVGLRPTASCDHLHSSGAGCLQPFVCTRGRFQTSALRVFPPLEKVIRPGGYCTHKLGHR